MLATCIGVLRELGDVAEASGATPRHKVVLTAIADSCFLARSELKPLLGQLQLGRADDSTIETMFRKMRRICTRVLMLLGPLVGRRVDLTAEHHEIVESSIALRRLYTRFRRSLVPCDDDAQVPAALDAGAASLAQLLGHVDSHDIRVQDALVFREMLARLLGWVSDSGTPEAGRRLHSDLTALADLLRFVNQRQELQAHDAEVISAALAMSEAGVAMSDALLMMLVPLEGLDDALDAARAQLAASATEDAASAVRERLRTLSTRG